jgi:nucleotide-binding universal stress UspA family protein
MTMNARRTVVVGVDGSPQALRAVRWAVPEARRRQAVLQLVTAFAWTEDRLVGLPGLGQAPYGQYLREAAEKGLVAAGDVAAEVDPDVPVERELVLGFPAGVLLERSQTAELLVVGDHGRGRIASAVAGSVALSVAARSACPVVVVRGAIPDGALPVVVGIDGTPLSEAAIPFAFDAAAARHVPLIAVHTWLDEINDPALAELVDWQTAAVRAEEVLAERLAGWGEKYPDVPVQRLVARGRAGHALLDQAARAQLAVFGSRGHGEIAGLLLDSVSNALVHGAGCPVAIVRSTR